MLSRFVEHFASRSQSQSQNRTKNVLYWHFLHNCRPPSNTFPTLPPHPLIAVNERGIAAGDGEGGAQLRLEARGWETGGQQGATNGGTVKFHPQRRRRRHCCALATAGIDGLNPLPLHS